MRLPGWWPRRPPRESQRLAEQAEADAERVHREVVSPLRQLREGDHIVDVIRRDARGHT